MSTVLRLLPDFTLQPPSLIQCTLCDTRPVIARQAMISVPSESSPESFACVSVQPDTHADEEISDMPDSCGVCITVHALLLTAVVARCLEAVLSLCLPLPCRCVSGGGDDVL